VQRFYNRWRDLSGPTKVGIVCAAIAVILVIVGQLRRPEDMTVRSVVMGVLIGGGSWGLVSWAIAYAAWDVESEVAAEESEAASAESQES